MVNFPKETPIGSIKFSQSVNQSMPSLMRRYLVPKAAESIKHVLPLCLKTDPHGFSRLLRDAIVSIPEVKKPVGLSSTSDERLLLKRLLQNLPP